MSLTSIFQDIANAIRSKTGSVEAIYPADMARAFCGDKWLPWQKCDGNHLIGTQGKSMPMYSIQIAKE